MEILVLVKRVPATDSQIKIAADGTSYDAQGVEFVLNPYDEFAVEEALKTKEARGGTVTVMTLGTSAAQKDLRTCLAMGADKAILLTCEDHPDSAAVASVLAEKSKELAPDLIFCGKQAVDDDAGQVGPRVATLLGFACATDVNSLEIGDDTFAATRDIEGGRETIEGKLPAVITCQKGLNEPRYPNLKGIMAAKKKPLDEAAATPPDNKVEVVALEPPAERPAPSILGEGAAAVTTLIDKLQNEAKVL